MSNYQKISLITIFFVLFLFSYFNEDFVYNFHENKFYYRFLYQFLHTYVIHFLINTFFLYFILYENKNLSLKEVITVFLISNFLISFAVALVYDEQMLIGSSGMILALYSYSSIRNQNIKYSEFISILLFSLIPGVSFSAHFIGIMTGLLLGYIKNKIHEP